MKKVFSRGVKKTSDTFLYIFIPDGTYGKKKQNRVVQYCNIKCKTYFTFLEIIYYLTIFYLSSHTQGTQGKAADKQALPVFT